MPRQQDPESLAGKIRALYAENKTQRQIANLTGATIKYVSWVCWNVDHGEVRRTWERHHRRERYQTEEDYRLRQRAAVKRSRQRRKTIAAAE